MRLRGTVLVVIVAVTAVCAVTSAVTAGAATVSPPVIKESFTPLKCVHDQTTLGIEGCTEQKILKSDASLDSLNAKIFARLTASGKKDFITGHNAWFTYRTAYCQSESDVFQGGTLAGIVDADCVANVNVAHVKELKDFWSSLNE